MSGLRPVGLGPIVGHTTDKTCRIWIQGPGHGGGPGGADSDRRTVGVIGLLTPNKDAVARAYYFRLQREFDRTGTFVVGSDVALGRHAVDGVPLAEQDVPPTLTPDTSYTVRVATLTVDDPIADAESISDVELAERLPPIEKIAPLLLKLPPESSETTFRTFPTPPAGNATIDRLDFMLGSCRYPGLLWKIKEADKIFAPLRTHLRDSPNGPAARFTLMIGDQIYADALNRHLPIARADSYDEFQERYQTAFSSPNMRELLRSAPNYMILDDHEIEDNWSHDRLSRKHQLFNVAIGAYASYQWSHSPRSYGRRLFYRFECGGYPFFALDTRTQRVKQPDDESLEDNHLLGRPDIDPAHPGQLRAFLDWLAGLQLHRGNVPKFVVTPSVFAPNPISERMGKPYAAKRKTLYQANQAARNKSDSWPAFPATREAILEAISSGGPNGGPIRNVIFLSGDVHCSNIAAIEVPSGAGAVTAYDITSSAFYWPFFFADGDPNQFVHDSRNEKQRDPFPIDAGEVHYKAWAFTQEDNFARLEVERPGSQLRTRFFDTKGRAIAVDGSSANGTVTLPLDAW